MLAYPEFTERCASVFGKVYVILALDITAIYKGRPYRKKYKAFRHYYDRMKENFSKNKQSIIFVILNY